MTIDWEKLVRDVVFGIVGLLVPVGVGDYVISNYVFTKEITSDGLMYFGDAWLIGIITLFFIGAFIMLLWVIRDIFKRRYC